MDPKNLIEEAERSLQRMYAQEFPVQAEIIALQLQLAIAKLLYNLTSYRKEPK